MTALRKATQDTYFRLRMSSAFKEGVERATQKAGIPAASEFIRQAIIEKAERYGVKIDRLK